MVRPSLLGLLVCAIGVCSIAMAAAQPAAPPAGYQIEPKYTKTSPDGAITIEQHLNKDTDDYKWQFWVRRQGTVTLLDPEPADYPAGFLFTTIENGSSADKRPARARRRSICTVSRRKVTLRRARSRSATWRGPS